ncbi:hypothetical protein DPMN_153723 [Dreissena polymorpha]|uniref:Discoidin domain-containing protein n=1 Tax=Dreissena polymorpha TaxID=45954 RepID=A0A9D4FMV3_DREPO|nr:hypothetical protein DPMN_153723 [Dreissena polymorpha]
MREVTPPIIGRRQDSPYRVHAGILLVYCWWVRVHYRYFVGGCMHYRYFVGGWGMHNRYFVGGWVCIGGDRRGSELDFVDFTYDGMIQENFLLEGLGQLTDGEIGDYNFRLDNEDLRIKGYEIWVGWRNDTQDFQGPLIITFKFDQVRNFSKVFINCNNLFSKEVRVFKRGWESLPELAGEYSRPVMIKLNNNLYFDAKWIMISMQPGISTYHKVMDLIPTEEKDSTGSTQETYLRVPPATLKPPLVPPKPEDKYYEHELNIGKDGKEKAPNQQTPGSDIIGIIIGSLAGLIAILIAINNNRRMKTALADTHNQITLNMSDLQGTHTNGKVLNGHMYNGVPLTELESDRECCSGKT